LLKLSGTTGNQVQGNFIGTDVSGTAKLGNDWVGVLVLVDASDNLIGGDRFTGSGPLGQGNLVSGNGHQGIELQGTGVSNNQIQGNFIGTDVSGTAEVTNAYNGLIVSFGASSNLIGGDASGVGNLISGHPENGLAILGAGTANNEVQGNLIGTDISGASALSNDYAGILIGVGAADNTVGGATIEAGNIVAFNGEDGVHVSGSQSLRNTISRNSIHDNMLIGIRTISGGNAELPPPTITRVISTTVSGQTQPGHIVELFTDNADEGRWFESNIQADGNGSFTLTYSGLNAANLTATATDANGNTSQFSAPVPAVVNGRKRVFLPMVLKNSG
jgi:hypothetical protein